MAGSTSQRAVVVQLPPPVLTLSLGLPPRLLSPNARVRGAKGQRFRHATYKKYRDEAYLVFVATLRRRRAWAPLQRCAVRATGSFRVRRTHDPDNFIASLKSVFDAAERAGVLCNDRDVVHLPPRFLVDPCAKAATGLRVEIFDIDLRFCVTTHASA